MIKKGLHNAHYCALVVIDDDKVEQAVGLGRWMDACGIGESILLGKARIFLLYS